MTRSSSDTFPEVTGISDTKYKVTCRVHIMLMMMIMMMMIMIMTKMRMMMIMIMMMMTCRVSALHYLPALRHQRG